MIRGLHHNAYRCRDSEETRQFYEDFLGLPLVNAFEITRDQERARRPHVLHSFYRDGRRLVPRVLRGARARRSSSRSSTTTTCTSRSRSPHDALEPMLAKAQAAGHRRARHRRSRHDRLDLLPRSERLRDRADREAARPRRRRWIRRRTARASSSRAGSKPSCNPQKSDTNVGGIRGHPKSGSCQLVVLI